MKLRILATMAIVGLLSTSFAYAADLTADDTASANSASASNDNIGNTQSYADASGSNPSSKAVLAENDDMSADTATGDDDY